MLKLLELCHVGPASALGLDFAPRLNVLTGDNGLGKTFALDVAWWSLTRTWVAEPAWVAPEVEETPRIRAVVSVPDEAPDRSVEGTYRFEAQDWSLSEGPPPRELVVYARSDGGFSVWDAVRNSRQATTRDTRQAAVHPAAFHFTDKALWDGLADGDRVICNGLIRDWVSWQRGGEQAFAELSKALSGLSPSYTEELRPGDPMRVRVEDARDIPTLQMPYGLVPLTHASAGLRRAVSLAYLLVWTWFEHCQAARLLKQEPAREVVLLVDELEAHLHPQWQRTLLPALLDVVAQLTRLDSAAVQIVAATHSPLVLASIEPVFDETQDAVFVFNLTGATVRAQGFPWAKQGDAVGWLTSEIFGLRQARSRDAERAIEAAEAWMREERAELPSGLGSEGAIHDELLRVLPGHDPFWPRWIVHHEGAGG